MGDTEGRIGVDESGKGDYFGPLVVAAVYVAAHHYAELEGVADSKKLTDDKALRLDGKIRATCPYAVIVMNPPKYNELHAKIGNLNVLLAWAHAQAIENVLKIQPAERAISDQFADPRRLIGNLKKKGLDIELESRVRAESDLAVAAASVVARAEFLRRLKSLGEQAGMDLPKGATIVEGPAKRLVATLGEERLGDFVKLHFKTTQRVLGRS